MPDVFELVHPCLDQLADDAAADPDADALRNISEWVLGTAPCPATAIATAQST